MKKPGKTIRLKADTVRRAERLKRRGLTWDGFFSDLLDVYEEKQKSGKPS